MIPVFVISLPDCHDRRATVSAALDGLGLPFQFADAVDGRQGLPPECESEIDRTEARRKGNILTDTEFACALSHINVYRRIVSEDLDYALVLEDDVIPQPDLVPYLAGRHYEDASLTQLGQSSPKIYVRRSGAKSLFDGYRSYLRAPMMKVAGTTGYVISRGAARHFVENALPVTREADWPECIEALIARRECRVVSPPPPPPPRRALVLHQDHGISIIDKSGRRGEKEKRRFLGLYVPPYRKTVDAWKRAPLKLLCKRLRACGA